MPETPPAAVAQVSPVLRDRIVELVRLPTEALRPNERNWRTHPPAQRSALAGLLAEIGIADALLAYRSARAGGALTLIDGHLRHDAARTTWPVLVLDLGDDEADKLLASLDPLAAMAGANAGKLAELLASARASVQSGELKALLERVGAKHGIHGDAKVEPDAIEPRYLVLVDCPDEAGQAALIGELSAAGRSVRALLAPVKPSAPRPDPPPLQPGEVEIVRSAPVTRSPRVIQLEGLFDLPPAERSTHTWRVKLDLPERWNVGLIVGPSGCGKSTIARELFGQHLVSGWSWPDDRCLLDGFPDRLPLSEIVALLSSVGFSSPPAWLKPFFVLSNGQQFRATLARTLAEQPELAVVDEFTSVVDRTVARVGSAALAKAVRQRNQRFVAVTCHFDVLEWLQPDWVYRPDTGELERRAVRRRPPIELHVCRTDSSAWRLFKDHHYLSASLHPAAQCFVGLVRLPPDDPADPPAEPVPACFTAVVHFPHPVRPAWREHRTVCLPDFQGVGLGNAMSEAVAEQFVATGKPYISTTSSPAMILHRARSPRWKLLRGPSSTRPAAGHVAGLGQTVAADRLTASFEYIAGVDDSSQRRSRF